MVSKARLVGSSSWAASAGPPSPEKPGGPRPTAGPSGTGGAGAGLIMGIVAHRRPDELPLLRDRLTRVDADTHAQRVGILRGGSGSAAEDRHRAFKRLTRAREDDVEAVAFGLDLTSSGPRYVLAHQAAVLRDQLCGRGITVSLHERGVAPEVREEEGSRRLGSGSPELRR